MKASLAVVSMIVILAACGGQPSANQPPSVSLSASVTEGQAPLAIILTASASDPDNDPLSYHWDFGDGDRQTGQASEMHTYQAVGEYQARVEVSDGRGGEASSTVTIKVNAAAPFNQQQTEKLLGSWTFSFTADAPTTETYTFNSIQASSGAPGEFIARGTNANGDDVRGGYRASLEAFVVTDERPAYDLRYQFTVDMADRVTGCVTLVYSPYNESDCYPLTGTKTS